MQTSHFKNWRNLPKGKAVAICIGVPGWYSGARNLDLAPTREMLYLPTGQYDILYAEILAKLNPKEQFDKMEAMVGGGAILLCWEAAPTKCHRSTVAAWFKEYLAIDVPEYQKLQLGLIL